MRKQFAEYYELPKECINEIWDNSLIVFDTNVLLNLYRYNDEARNEFIKIIKFYKKRLWIPYQVGLEFHRRREDIMRKNAAAYKLLGDSISEQLLKVVDSLSSERDYARHPYINMKDIKNKVERLANTIKKSLEKQEKEHPDYSNGDDTLTTITELYDGHVGDDFAEKDLEMLYKEGEKRYTNKIPPGYCDEKNKKDKGKRSLYGDLIVWKQTILQSKDKKQDVIFVTDDHKEDWWNKVDGKHSPRKELIKEFLSETGQKILIYDSKRFLEYANKNKELKVSQKTIKEVEKIRTADISKYMDETIRFIQAPSVFDSIDSFNVYKDYLYNPISNFDVFPNMSYVSEWQKNLVKFDESVKKWKEDLQRIQEAVAINNRNFKKRTQEMEMAEDSNNTAE